MKHATIVVLGFALWLTSGRVAITPSAIAATPVAPAAATSSAALQTQIDAYNQQINALNQQIADYQAKLQQIGADKKTLQAAIKALDLQRSKVQTQIAVTQRQIGATQLQIQQLGNQIVDTEQAIADDQAALAAYLRNLQVADHKPLIIELLRSSELSQIWSEANATVQIEDGIRGKMDALQSQRSDLASTQAATQEKQQSLTVQQQSLALTVASKNQLLADTKAQESNYQKLLAAAEAQLESFSAFAQNAGGSKLVGNQTVCDSWGCYYNQRDTAWGSNSLNGTRYTLASDGCLVTSMAMMMTHYGYRDVTPVTINSNPNNFAVYYPAYLLTTIMVDGMTVTRKTAAIDATLATGNPVVVGVRAYGGTHFVVLVSGSRGRYLMRDPYIPNGKDINFSDHYAVRSIFGITKVVIGS